MHNIVKIISGGFFSIGMLFGFNAIYAQTYPNRPIRIIAPDAGGGTDLAARVVAQEISAPLGQPLVVDNRPAGLIGELGAKAPADGYTILLTAGVMWITPLVQKTSYDPIKDFSPITWLTSTPHILVVYPSVQAQSIKELIELAKARPGALNYASGPTGGESHLGPELFKVLAGVNIVRVPYKGTGPAVSALLSGETQMMFINAAAALPQIKAGKVRALAITSLQPSPLAPEIPTMASAGLAGYEMLTLTGALVPSGTSPAIIARLNQEMIKALVKADVRQTFLNTGAEVVGSTPEQFGAKIKSEIAKWGKVFKESGIKME